MSSRREFTPHPLGDNKVNAMLAASFKAGWKGGAATSDAEMQEKTSYKAPRKGEFTRLSELFKQLFRGVL